jgi:voltage-gated potassium channel
MVLPPRRLTLVVAIPTLLILIGMLGYRFIEDDCTLFDGLYMTIITLTTVGYAEHPHVLSTAGRVFTIFLLLGGVFTFFYTATEIIRMVLTGELRDIMGRQQVEQSLAELKGHVIVCGYGRLGKSVCTELSQLGMDFVIIDFDHERLNDFALPHGLPLVGDATSDEVLRHAGVERAKALVAAAPSDADNLYITMSARLLNEGLFIISRAEEMPAEQKLLRAGANRVISPHLIGGRSIAQSVSKPNVVEFIELATRTEHQELQIEEIELLANCSLVGRSLKESDLHRKHGIYVVAIKKPFSGMIATPQADTVLEVGDILIALGNRAQLDVLEKMAR